MVKIHAAHTANNSQIVERKQRVPLRKPALHTLRNSTGQRRGEKNEAEKTYPRRRRRRRKRRRKNIAQEEEKEEEEEKRRND